VLTAGPFRWQLVSWLRSLLLTLVEVVLDYLRQHLVLRLGCRLLDCLAIIIARLIVTVEYQRESMVRSISETMDAAVV